MWNDVFMARKDLPKGYGGWQAIDATPQERSGRKFQCGPASVAAVRAGMVGLAHDVPFVFAEVNSDVVSFTEDPASPWGYSRSRSHTYHVGRLVVTKAVGQLDTLGEADLHNITLAYKMAERDAGERSALMNAVRGNTLARGIYGYPEDTLRVKEVAMSLQDPPVVAFGQGFTLRLSVENTSSSSRTVETRVACSSVYYTGVPGRHIKVARGRFVLAGHQRDVVALAVSPGDYMPRMVEYCHVKVTAMLRVVETGETWTDEDDFVLDKPRLTVTLEGEAVRRREARVRVEVRNPLDRELTGCYFLVEGAGVVREGRREYRDVQPGEQVVAVLPFLPRRPGTTLLLVRFNSAEMVDVNGSLSVRVLP